MAADSTKFKIKQALEEMLYGPFEKDFKKRLDNLITRNAVAAGAKHLSFMYEGEFYRAEPGPGPKARTRLREEFVGEMEELLQERKHIEQVEKPHVIGFIICALNLSVHRADFLRLFPESTHELIKKVVGESNFRNEGLTDEVVEQFKKDHEHRIALLRGRMALNLMH